MISQRGASSFCPSSVQTPFGRSISGAAGGSMSPSKPVRRSFSTAFCFSSGVVSFGSFFPGVLIAPSSAASSPRPSPHEKVAWVAVVAQSTPVTTPAREPRSLFRVGVDVTPAPVLSGPSLLGPDGHALDPVRHHIRQIRHEDRRSCRPSSHSRHGMNAQSALNPLCDTKRKPIIRRGEHDGPAFATSVHNLFLGYRRFLDAVEECQVDALNLVQAQPAG